MRKTLLVMIAAAVIVVFIGCGDTTDAGLRSVSAQDVDPAGLGDYEGTTFDGDLEALAGVLEDVGPLLIDAMGAAFEDDDRFGTLTSMAAATISATGTSSEVGTAAIDFELSDEDANPMTVRIRITKEQWDLDTIAGSGYSGSIEIPSFRLDARVFFGDTSVEGSLDTKGSVLVANIEADDGVAYPYSIVDGRINLDAVGEFTMWLDSDDTIRVAYEYKLAVKSGFSVSGTVGGKYIITFLSNGKGSFVIDDAVEAPPIEDQLLANLGDLNLEIRVAVYNNDDEQQDEFVLTLEDILAMMEPETL